MKKKLFSIALIVAMVFSATGCGEDEGASSDDGIVSNQSSVEQGSAELNTNDSGADITESSDDVPELGGDNVDSEEQEETPKIISAINNTLLFRNGSWIFSFDGKKYLYNIEDEKIIEIDSSINKIIDVSGYAVIYDGDGYRKVVNVETGEVYVDAEKDDLSIVKADDCYFNGEDGYFIDDSLLVMRKEDSFDGTTVSFGTMNNKGEYTNPFSGDHNVDLIDVPYEWRILNKDIILMQATYFILPNKHTCYYDIVNDEQLVFDDNNTYIAEKGVAKIDDREQNMNDEAIVKLDAWLGDVSKAYVTDVQTGEVDSYELSEYNVDSSDLFPVPAKDTLLFISNKSNGDFLCVMNKNGELEFEPFKVTYFNFMTGITYENNKYICLNPLNQFMYNVETKELFRCNTDENDASYMVFRYYDNVTDTFLVEANHPEYGKGFYMAHPDDLTTLVHPFEG
ncbi:MAG: hypothetical protein IJZ95_08215 [Oscillospiraceae bacterium]|nr:hypothetical protein [Oscillospiraceae bacterium]